METGDSYSAKLYFFSIPEITWRNLPLQQSTGLTSLQKLCLGSRLSDMNFRFCFYIQQFDNRNLIYTKLQRKSLTADVGSDKQTFRKLKQKKDRGSFCALKLILTERTDSKNYTPFNEVASPLKFDPERRISKDFRGFLLFSNKEKSVCEIGLSLTFSNIVKEKFKNSVC